MRLPTTHSDATPAPGVSRRWPIWLVASLLGLLTVVLYWPATHNDFVNYDDDIYVTGNFSVQDGLTAANISWAFSHQVSANWHPLTLLSHMLDCQLYGLNPWGHHLTSLLLHAGNAVLVFLLLWRLTGAQWRSLWVALFFACHPVHVESVAWVAERKDVLSGFFGLLALLFYAEFAGRQRLNPPALAPVPGFYRCPYYWLAWFSFALGLMSKPMLVTWPFVLLLLDYWPLTRFQAGCWRVLVVEKLPFLALTVASCIITYAVQQHVGAMAAESTMTLGMRSANALVAYGCYVGQWFWPQNLACLYWHPGQWPTGWVLLAGAGLLGITAWGWRQRERQPHFLMGWLWFVGTLVPVIGLVQVGSQAMADRYNYLPSIGLLVLIVWSMGDLIRAGRLNRTLVLAVGLTALCLCVRLTERQIGYWQNSETLFRHALAVARDNELTRNNLGGVLLERGEVAAAISEFEAAVRLKPQSSLIHSSLGSAFFKKGDLTTAIREFQTAIQLAPNNAEAYNNLALTLIQQGQTNAAIGQFQTVIKLDPDNVKAHYHLGDNLAKLGDKDGAIREFQIACQLRPKNIEIHYKLGNLLAAKGQTAMAIQHFQEALRLQPDFAEAHVNLGCLLTRPDQANAAISQFLTAIQIKPDYLEAHYNLGNVYLKIGRFDLATNQYQASLKLQPNLAPAHYYLGVALSALGQMNAAIEQFQITLKLQPNHVGAAKNLAQALEMQTGATNSTTPGSDQK